MPRRLASSAALFLAFGLGAPLGWWSVAAVAGLWGLLRPRVKRPAAAAALAAGAGWALWLVIDAVGSRGAFQTLGLRVAGVMRLPVPALYLVTVLFPALIAWSACALAGGIAGLISPPAGETR